MTLKTHSANFEELLMKAIREHPDRYRPEYTDGILVSVADADGDVLWVRLPEGGWGWCT